MIDQDANPNAMMADAASSPKPLPDRFEAMPEGYKNDAVQGVTFSNPAGLTIPPELPEILEKSSLRRSQARRVSKTAFICSSTAMGIMASFKISIDLRRCSRMPERGFLSPDSSIAE